MMKVKYKKYKYNIHEEQKRTQKNHKKCLPCKSTTQNS